MNTENPDNKQKQRKVLPLAYLMCSRPLKPNLSDNWQGIVV